jgi:hypothetical protein
MVDVRNCTCGAPGVGCGGVTCTPHGWVCPDAGFDVDERADATIIDAEAGAESRDEAGTDGPRCCPRDPTMGFGVCSNLGGANRFGCFATCDFWCSTNWRVEVDDQGCEFWAMDYRQPKPGENRMCFPDNDARADTDAAPDGQ